QSLVIPCTVSAVSGHLLYCVRSLWSISCTVSTVSGHPLYCVCSLLSSPVLYLQSLVISCTMSAVSGHPLYCVRISGHFLYYVCSPLVQNIFFSCLSPLKPKHV
ncbi:unnamed protein product, partial [Staurois parvus]